MVIKYVTVVISISYNFICDKVNNKEIKKIANILLGFFWNIMLYKLMYLQKYNNAIILNLIKTRQNKSKQLRENENWININ